ncbi:hypothetical protein GS504_01250 [Rhodococcus hoagii]|nr:hypothetical protein [Prescottella equi]NKS71700.1 hypothetical protein [Prescottella equi]
MAAAIAGCGPDDGSADLPSLGIDSTALSSINTAAATKAICSAGSIWTEADPDKRRTLATTVHRLIDPYRENADATVAAAAGAVAAVVDAGDQVTQASMDAFNRMCAG